MAAFVAAGASIFCSLAGRIDGLLPILAVGGTGFLVTKVSQKRVLRIGRTLDALAPLIHERDDPRLIGPALSVLRHCKHVQEKAYRAFLTQTLPKLTLTLAPPLTDEEENELRHLVFGDDPALCRAVLETLPRLEDLEAIPALRRFLQQDNHPENAEAAARCLQKLLQLHQTKRSLRFCCAPRRTTKPKSCCVCPQRQTRSRMPCCSNPSAVRLTFNPVLPAADETPAPLFSLRKAKGRGANSEVFRV